MSVKEIAHHRNLESAKTPDVPYHNIVIELYSPAVEEFTKSRLTSEIDRLKERKIQPLSISIYLPDQLEGGVAIFCELLKEAGAELHDLTVNVSDFSDISSQIGKSCINLHSLRLTRNTGQSVPKQPSKECLDVISSLGQLKTVNISTCFLSTAYTSQLIGALPPSVVNLQLISNSLELAINAPIISFLKKGLVEHLTLSVDRLKNKSLDSLKEALTYLVALKSISLGPEDSIPLLETITNHSTLKSLFLSGLGDIESTVNYLASLLNAKKGPENINLRLSPALKKSTQRPYFISLRKNNWIQSLSLSHVPQDTESVSALADFIRQSNLKILHLGGQDLTERSIGEIISALIAQSNEKGVKVKKLAIESSRLPINHIYQFVKNNSSIISLNLSKCGISTEGLQILTEGLKTTIHLTELNLESNIIDHSGVSYIVDLILNHHSLSIVRLANNHSWTFTGPQSWGNETVKILANGLGRSLNLAYLALTLDMLDDDSIASLCSLIFSGLAIDVSSSNMRTAALIRNAHFKDGRTGLPHLATAETSASDMCGKRSLIFFDMTMKEVRAVLNRYPQGANHIKKLSFY